jgi:hypothetical protein
MGPFSLVHFHRKSQIINITQRTSKENVAKKSWFQTVLYKRITESFEWGPKNHGLSNYTGSI